MKPVTAAQLDDIFMSDDVEEAKKYPEVFKVDGEQVLFISYRGTVAQEAIRVNKRIKEQHRRIQSLNDLLEAP